MTYEKQHDLRVSGLVASVLVRFHKKQTVIDLVSLSKLTNLSLDALKVILARIQQQLQLVQVVADKVRIVQGLSGFNNSQLVLPTIESLHHLQNSLGWVAFKDLSG